MVLSSLLFASLAKCETWAVMLTGSNTFDNYRHQADSFCLFNMLKRNGIPRSNVIFLCYNDVVNSASNPFKGEVFRSLEHKDIYPGASAIDYTARDVTAQNFYKVLTGDSSSGKALKSTANDDVFIFFEDHGGDSILGVPEGNGDYIYADALHTTLKAMSSKKLFKRCFFSITACYAGSVAKVSNDIPNLYIMTASNDHESAYACMYDSSIGTYLASEYTLCSQQYYDDHPAATIGDAYKGIKSLVKQSHVCKYGDMSIEKAPVSSFIGKSTGNVVRIDDDLKIYAKETLARLSQLELGSSNGLKTHARIEMEKALELKASKRIESIVSGLKDMFPGSDGSSDNINWDAYKEVLRHLQSRIPYLGESFYDNTAFFRKLSSEVAASEIIHAIDQLL